METIKIKLSEVIDDIAAGPFGSNLKVSCFVDYGFPIIDGANLKEYKVTDNITKFVTEEKARSLHRSIAKRGDIVVTISGTLGQIAYIPNDSKFKEYLCSQRQFRVTFNSEKVYPPYLVFYFHTWEGQHKILAFANQTGVPALSQPLKNFKNIIIELPNIEVQKKIASFCEMLNDKIEQNNKINKNLLKQAMSIYKAWFCDYILFGGIRPAAWKNTTIDSVSTLVTRGIAPKYDENSNQIVLNQKCIRDHTIDLSLARRHIPKKINEKWIKKGDLLINSTGTGTLGRVAQVWFDANNMTVDSHVTIVRPKSPILESYIGFWGLSHENEIEAQHTGSTGQTELPRERVKSMELLLPDAETLSKFNDLVIPMTSTVELNQEENTRLSQLRDVMLTKLMSAKIDVSNIDI